eukprot:TRINITY_DN16644_c0_g5_i1.p1 TRINITY_DN16644_c0_g5~~TRINITY_DN16644_c0_g5_i1.p1  ORF type:complete len:188 (+),score=22.61 TRINITY_DN16644_c0_g5_i1:85-648(+)
MVGGIGQHMEGKNIAEKYTAVEAMEREMNKMAGKVECQAKGGYSSLDQECEDLCVSSQPSLNSECSTLVPRPPPRRRPSGGKNFRLKFQSAPLPEPCTETTPERDGCSPDGCAPKTRIDSAMPLRQTSGRAPSRLRAKVLGAQVQQHRSVTLENFQPIEDISDGDELMSELSDTDGEESFRESQAGR